MSATTAAILDGMPDPRDLHRLDSGGETANFAGRVELFRFAEDDAAMRHVAAAGLRQLGFPGQDVAAVLGLTPNYVATLHQRALREGTAGLVRAAGRPPETSEASWQRAREWRAAGVRDAEITRRLGVNQSTVLRRLGRAHVQDPLPPEPHPEPETDERPARRRLDPRRGRNRGRGTRSRPRHPGRSRPRHRRPDRGQARRSRGPGRRRSGPGTGGDAAARLRRAGRGGGRPAGRRGRGRAAGRGGAAVGGQHVLRARRGDHRAVQAPGRGRGRAAGRAGGPAGPADAGRRWPASPTAPTR